MVELDGTELRWVAGEGETPSWDIQYVDASSQLVAVEVKSTSAAAFTSVELTQNEWDAARKLRNRYWLLMVTECLGLNPKIHIVKDPAELVDNGKFSMVPIGWRLALPS